jgi:hypothetical protein
MLCVGLVIRCESSMGDWPEYMRNRHIFVSLTLPRCGERGARVTEVQTLKVEVSRLPRSGWRNCGVSRLREES